MAIPLVGLLRRRWTRGGRRRTRFRERGGDYLLAVKGNQPNLQAAVKHVFADACAKEFAGTTFTQHATVGDGHGRHEERYVTVIPDPTGLPADWTDAKALVLVNRERGKTGLCNG